MLTLSTHVLDTSRGLPAAGISLVLEKQGKDLNWFKLNQSITNGDGRVPQLSPEGTMLTPGIYRLTFETLTYFQKLGNKGLYPYISIVFEIQESELSHYHIPLLLSPYGYSTYRGS